MSQYQQLIYESGLYPLSFIKEYGESSTHWNLESDRSKEVFLRHQMVCVLLSNMQMTSVLSPEPFPPSEDCEPTPKRLKLGSGQGSSGSGASTIGIEEQNDPGVVINIDGGPPSSQSHPSLRIIILEGDPFIERTQNKICNEIGISPWDTKWDLYDRQELKFIEVKVSMDKKGSRDRFEIKKAQNPDNAALVIANPETISIEFIDHPGDLQGKAKVEDFLIRRKMEISNLGLMETGLSDMGDVISTIFCNERTNNMVNEWVDGFWNERHRPIPYNMIPETVNKVRDTGYQIVNPQMILSKLEDPSIRQTPDVSQWNAKLPPVSWLSFETMVSEKDHDLISEWLERNSPGPDCPRPWKALIEHWENLEEPSTFKLLGKKERSNPKFESVLELLGIGKKTTVLNVEDLGTRQKDFEGPPKTRFDPCFSHVMKDLTEPLPEGEMTFFNVSQDTRTTDHPMAKLSSLLFDEIFLMFSKSFAGAQSSMVSNFYSRLGGAYVSPESIGSKRSNVVWFPVLYNVCDALGNKSRKMAGICVRGPQHAKFGTDKINVAFLLKIDSCPWNDRQIEVLFKKGFRWESENGSWMSYRTSLNKDDSSYLTFPLNSLFVVCNLFGEIMLNNEDKTEANDLLEDGRNSLNLSRNWYMDRMVEALCMGMMGGPQEEGVLTGLRKLFMSMIAWSRQDPVSCISPDAFCDDINECLLNRPMAQHFVKQFIMALVGYDPINRTFS